MKQDLKIKGDMNPITFETTYNMVLKLEDLSEADVRTLSPKLMEAIQQEVLTAQ